MALHMGVVIAAMLVLMTSPSASRGAGGQAARPRGPVETPGGYLRQPNRRSLTSVSEAPAPADWDREDCDDGDAAETPATEPSPWTRDASAQAIVDYIVVGAGAAGGAVAARLALAGNEVLLIEAGGDPGFLSKIPNAAMALMGSDIDWFYETVSNNVSCLSRGRRQCQFSRGRCLGGSTSINYMLYTRGNPRDYDFDVPGWSWRDLKPYFLRSEGLRSLIRLPPSSSRYHNTSGRVTIDTFERSRNPWNERIVNGLTDLKFPFNPDVNAESQIGVSRVLGYVSGGERVSTATAYLNTRDVKRKLKIASNVRCVGVIFDEYNVARGVSVLGDDARKRPTQLYVKKEVILSAGTIGSPQILMLSGIGVAEHLQTMGISVRADLPVGENMSDHVLPLLFVAVDRAPTVPNLFEIFGHKSIDVIQWLTTRTGPLASMSVTDVVAFANTKCYDFKSHKLKRNSSECGVPTLQMIFAYVDRYMINIASYVFERTFSTSICRQIFAANKHSAFLIVSPILLRPKSRGWVRLSSKDPTIPPAITPNYLADDADVQEIVQSIRIVEHLLQTSAFSRNNATLLKFKLPGCPEAGERGYWECYVRHMTSSAQHAVGTVELGKVVDGRLRVRGVRRLRVGDASVLPGVPRGNTAAAAIAVGERLAHLLLEDN